MAVRDLLAAINLNHVMCENKIRSAKNWQHFILIFPFEHSVDNKYFAPTSQLSLIRVLVDFLLNIC